MSNNLCSILSQSLDDIKHRNLYRDFRVSSDTAGAYFTYNDKKFLQLSSNNYLGLANDERLKEASIKAIEKYGLGSTGSRLTSGTHKLHVELEEKIAELKGTEKALVFSTGYAANVGILSSILTENDAVYSDELNHASIIDGIKLSKAAKFIYKHCNCFDLERLLQENHNKYRINLIVTDSIFSMDGDRAPLHELVNLKEKYNAELFLDEAHSFGIYGLNGQGLAHKLNIDKSVDIQMGTLSKAAGSEGGYVAGKKEIIDYLKNKSRSFIFSTAPSIPSIAASIEAVNIIKNGSDLRSKLHSNIMYLKNELEKLSLSSNIVLFPSNSAIFCVKVGGVEETLGVSKSLFDDFNIMALAIRPPTVKDSRIRICTMADHSQRDLIYFIEKIKTVVNSQS